VRHRKEGAASGIFIQSGKGPRWLTNARDLDLPGLNMTLYLYDSPV
jgi:hypothetical protein